MNADGSNRRILRRSTVWGDAGKPSWSPNGKGIAYENRSTDSIDYVNADDTGHRVLRVKAFSPAWSPNGKTIAFTNASGDLWVMNANGKGARPLLRADRLSLFDAPAWSPDGTKIAFVRLHGILDGTIFIINADGTDPHFLLPPLSPLTSSTKRTQPGRRTGRSLLLPATGRTRSHSLST